jgi:iron complex outermembrane receptor protein
MAQNSKANLSTLNKDWFQNRLAVFETIKWQNFNQKLQQQFTIRQEWADGKMVPTMPAYGFNLALGKQFNLFGNLAKSYRLPTFNDLYWPGMGNKDLLPEEGWNQELSLSNQFTYKQSNIKSTLTAFNKNIQNWIIWVPNGGTLSTPKNVYQVWSRGIEYDWRIKTNAGKFNFTFRGLHDYTLATNQESNIPNDASLNKQIIYTPRIKHMLQFSLQYKTLSFEYTFNYVGTRYVSADHSNWLNPYNFSGLNLGKVFIIKQKSIQCLFSIGNLFNQTYQVLVNRPMSLINYQFSLNFKL